MENSKYKNFWKTFGPGIMFAGTCIGGSHLIQSTKAGAFYGFGLLGIVLLANIFKYPFLEFASRYTSATGDSILEGYKRIGKWVLIVYLTLTVLTMFVITTAIVTVTGGLANNMTGEVIPAYLWPLIIFGSVFILLANGNFKILDIALKVIGLVLVLTLCVAFFSVFFDLPAPTGFPPMVDIVSDTEGYGLMFVIALMGWMPIGIDMSAWHSLWTQERIKQTGYHPTLKETLLDFNIGYVITIVTALFFLTIGAYVLYNNPAYGIKEINAMSPVSFSRLLVDLFATAVGSWSKPIVALAAFATMFGTSITLVDGYGRTIERIVALLKSDKAQEEMHKRQYLLWVVILCTGSYLIYLFFVSSLSKVVDFATALSFIIAPAAAILNYKIIYSKEVDIKFHPPKWLKFLALAGIVFLTTFTIVYLITLM